MSTWDIISLKSNLISCRNELRGEYASWLDLCDTRINPIAFWYIPGVEWLLIFLYGMGLVAYFQRNRALSGVCHIKSVEYAIDIPDLVSSN